MENIYESETQNQDAGSVVYEPRYATVLDPVNQPLCTYQKHDKRITCLSCFAKLVARSRNHLVRLVSTSPSNGSAYWVFFDVDGNEAGWTPMCEHEDDEPRRPTVLASVSGPC